MSNNDLAFIGGGATGTMLLIYLAQKVQDQNISLTDQRFHLIDPKGFGHGGLAYNECGENHLLNSVRTEMSPWDISEFHKWCQDNDLGDDVNQFNLRSDYGRFIEEKYVQSVEILKAVGAEIIPHECKAEIKSNQNGTFEIINQDNGTIILPNMSNDNIYLTAGYGDPNNAFDYLKDQQGYVHNLYDKEAMQAVFDAHENPEVVFIGAGAALNDFAVEYSDIAKKTGLTSFSANGEPLNIRDTSLEESEVRQEPIFLNTVFNNAAELQDAIHQELNDDSNLKRSLRRRALDLTKYLNTLLDNQRKNIAVAFRKSALATQLRHDATPVPPESHEKLKSFEPEYVKGRLNGNIQTLEDGGFKIEHAGKTYHADIIINGTGHQNIPPIIQKMMEDDLAKCNPKTGTAQTTKDGVRLAGCGIPCAGSAINTGTHGMESNAPVVEKISDITIAQIIASQDRYSVGYGQQVANTAKHAL